MNGILNNYEVIIYWDDVNKCFISEVPELVGCVSDGSTHMEAINNVQGVIVDWISTARSMGHPIPEPRMNLMY